MSKTPGILTPKQKEAKERREKQLQLDDLLINIIRDYPALYNHTIKDHKNAATKAAIWNEIVVQKMGMDEGKLTFDASLS